VNSDPAVGWLQGEQVILWSVFCKRLYIGIVWQIDVKVALVTKFQFIL
jgi:hypothetical protein